jgi:hypothetical protein
LPNGIATVGLSEAAEASEISAVIEKKGFYKNVNLTTTNVESPENGLTPNKSLKVLRSDELVQQNEPRLNTRFEFNDPI